ncbi:MAG: response regulator [Pseudomonadota bacterium]
MKVLIVDNSRAMRIIVKRTLKQAGIVASVTEADNRSQAFEAIDAGKPDVILTGCSMPDRHGLEFVRAITDSDLDVPVGVVVSQGASELQKQATTAGACFLLTKPLTADSLRDALLGVFG